MNNENARKGRIKVKKTMQFKSAGDRWKPNAVVKKTKAGIPTVIEINGMLYTFSPSRENTQAANEHRDAFRKRGEL